MTGQGLTLRHLCFTGVGLEPAAVQFGPGLNVVSGASETGKSFIFESIDFMLGWSGDLRDIPERSGYDRVFLGVEDGQGDAFTLERATSGGEFRCYEGLHLGVPEGAEPKILSAKHNPNNEENLSTFLLKRVGLSGKKVRKNAQGDSNSLSFRTLVPFILVSEGEIQKQGSPIETGQFTSKTSEFSTFKLLLTGVDDSAYQATKGAKTEGVSKAAKIEIIDELIMSYRDRLTGFVGEDDSEPDLRAQIEKLDSSLAGERDLMQATEKAYRLAMERRNVLRRNVDSVMERRGEIADLLGRFHLLDQHYTSDLERLEGIREAGALVAALNPQTCPLCGAAPGSQHLEAECDGNVDLVVRAADAERAKVARLLVELRATTGKLFDEATGFDTTVPELSQALATVEAELAAMSPSVTQRRAAYTELVDRRAAVQGALTVLASISELEARKAAVSETVGKPEEKAEWAIELSASILDEFSKIFEDTLKSWNFPDASRVYFDTTKRDFVIAGKPRGSRGKGLRAITHAAFTVSLLEFTREKKRPHPGFIVLDTPLLAYREPDGDEDDLSGTDVQERFYQYLSEFSERQVIILENVDPPENIKARSQTTIFSRNPHHGRFGFFPIR